MLCNLRWKRELSLLSPHAQTSSTEAVNVLILWFSPKNVHCGYKGMQSCLLLAALHYNKNSDRNEWCTNDGEPVYAVSWRKYNGGRATRARGKIVNSPSLGK